MLHCSNGRNIGPVQVDVKKNVALQQNNFESIRFYALFSKPLLAGSLRLGKLSFRIQGINWLDSTQNGCKRLNTGPRGAVKGSQPAFRMIDSSSQRKN